MVCFMTILIKGMCMVNFNSVNHKCMLRLQKHVHIHKLQLLKQGSRMGIPLGLKVIALMAIFVQENAIQIGLVGAPP